MNTAHWHLMLNHLPIVGMIIGTLILAAGFILKNNPSIKDTSLGVFIFSAICAIPAYLTGEGAEEVVENLPGVTEAAIETHEELAQSFLILAIIIGVVAVLALLTARMKNKIAPILYGIVLVMGIGVSVFAKQVGTSGGEVRHTEIRSGAAQQPAGGATEQNGEAEDDD